MKKFTLALLSLLVVGSFTLFAQEDKSQRKSPPMKTEGMIGDSKIVIDYSSPSVKGREIFGGLVKYGKVWRAGANEATTIDFSMDVKVNGKDLAAGKYSFFVMPVENGDWTIIFNTEPKQWGAYKLDESKNALKIKAKATDHSPTEKLTYSIDGDNIHLDWANSRLSFTVK